jgi:ABC-type transport system substrate-binding protein
MAGEVDVIPVGYMKAEEAFVLKTQWEPTGAGSIIQSNVKLRNGYWQWRDPSAPWVPDVRVRLAMLRLIDRQNLVDTLHNGLSGVDDIFWPKDHPVYQLARQRGLPDTSFNPDQAHRLLTEAGMTRGADGTYRTSSGTPFTLEATTSGDINTNVQELIAIANAWQTAGLQTTQNIITTNTEAREIEANTRGVRMTSEALDFVGYDGALTSEVASAATRWRGRNSGGYSNPVYDDMHKRMMSTVDLAQQHSMGADLVKFQLDNMVYLPLVYSPSFSANRTNVRGLTTILPYQRMNAWNVHTWEMG